MGAPVSQLVEEAASKSAQCGFESHRGHRYNPSETTGFLVPAGCVSWITGLSGYRPTRVSGGGAGRRWTIVVLQASFPLYDRLPTLSQPPESLEPSTDVEPAASVGGGRGGRDLGGGVWVMWENCRDFPVRACSPVSGVGVYGNPAALRILSQRERWKSAVPKNHS